MRENVKISIRQKLHSMLVNNDRLCFCFAMTGVFCAIIAVSRMIIIIIIIHDHHYRASSTSGVIPTQAR